MVAAYQELQEATLGVAQGNDLHDLLEVQLRFERQTPVNLGNVGLTMLNLKRGARPLADRAALARFVERSARWGR